MLNLQEVVTHIVNGTLSESLCKVCLVPLDEVAESIFTKICKESAEYSIADVLENVCRIKIADDESSFICSDCFTKASEAYKFFLQTKRSEEIIQLYVQELDTHIANIDLSNEVLVESLCISLPEFTPETLKFDFNYEGVLSTDVHTYSDFKPRHTKKDNSDSEDEIIVIMDKGKQTQYKFKNGELRKINCSKMKQFGSVFKNSNGAKLRRKRDPMEYRQCSQCPVKYRFLSKLKEHMLNDHKIELHICKICKAIFENYGEFQNHLRTHLDTMTCDHCDRAFKRREKIEAHMKTHQLDNSPEKAHICEHCGTLLEDEERLQDHYEKKHLKKYTCYYCGKMYKGELSFEMHIKKHEIHMKNEKGKKESTDKKKARNFTCTTCGRSFVDGRSLMWHTRLHTNERPYKCETCGRGFISLNRRNQHSVCAHSAPARRCPLCPALFHLTSMVNTHIKKVHLKSHKRKNRTSKYNDVYWRTEPVQLQELSVSVQNELLEMQTQKQTKSEWIV